MRLRLRYSHFLYTMILGRSPANDRVRRCHRLKYYWLKDIKRRSWYTWGETEDYGHYGISKIERNIEGWVNFFIDMSMEAMGVKFDTAGFSKKISKHQNR